MSNSLQPKWIKRAALLSVLLGFGGLFSIGFFYMKCGEALNALEDHKIATEELDKAIPFLVNSIKSCFYVYCSALNCLLIILGGGILLCRNRSEDKIK